MAALTSCQCSIILVTWNGWARTEACLRGLSPFPESVEILVVDNASSDGTPAQVSQLFPDVRLIETGANLGFGTACNRGAAEAKGRWLLFLNNDTHPSAEWLKRLFQSMESCGPDAILTCLARSPEGLWEENLMQDGHPLRLLATAWISAHRARSMLCVRRSPECGIQPVPWSSALCWLMERRLFLEAGGFDENIFLYYEDAELAWRLRLRGGRFFVDTDLVLFHDCGGSSPGNLFRSSCHDRSQRYYFGKRWGRVGKTVSILFQILRSVPRAIASLLLTLVRPSAASHARLHALLAWRALVGLRN